MTTPTQSPIGDSPGQSADHVQAGVCAAELREGSLDVVEHCSTISHGDWVTLSPTAIYTTKGT